MKVYAQLITDENTNIRFRKNTLLQFGDSNRLIGSAVLVNPGSAVPSSRGIVDLPLIRTFYEQNHNIGIKDDTSLWHEYTVDSTMRQLEKIFNGWYINVINEGVRKPKKELNGVIQLFNLFNVMNAKQKDALIDYNTTQSKHKKFNESHLFSDKPVYLGWGNLGKWDLEDISKEIFKELNFKSNPQYDRTFDDNLFYHPGYINRSFSRNPNSKKLLLDFYSLLDK
jgi:hypothetical protein